MKSYICYCHKTTYHETDKALGFELKSGMTSQRVGFKYFPKSRIQINFGKCADPGTVEIIIPIWLFKDISKNVIIDGLEIDGYTE